MNERPILFSGEMVRAIIAGRKTQTRRVIKSTRQTEWLLEGGWSDAYIKNPGNYLVEECPYGQPGDRLWVKETIKAEELESGLDGIRYKADTSFMPIDNTPEAAERWCAARWRGNGWRPGIFMPRWASRITLEIVDVRVERVQEITMRDAIAEGVQVKTPPGWEYTADEQEKFRELWNSINAPRGYGWEANPWVWVIVFKVCKFKKIEGE